MKSNGTIALATTDVVRKVSAQLGCYIMRIGRTSLAKHLLEMSLLDVDPIRSLSAKEIMLGDFICMSRCYRSMSTK